MCGASSFSLWKLITAIYMSYERQWATVFTNYSLEKMTTACVNVHMHVHEMKQEQESSLVQRVYGRDGKLLIDAPHSKTRQ